MTIKEKIFQACMKDDLITVCFDTDSQLTGIVSEFRANMCAIQYSEGQSRAFGYEEITEVLGVTEEAERPRCKHSDCQRQQECFPDKLHCVNYSPADKPVGDIAKQRWERNRMASGGESIVLRSTATLHRIYVHHLVTRNKATDAQIDLMAIAPEMLEILEEMCLYMRGRPRNDHMADIIWNAEIVIKKARSA